jgi:hypothetical protein
VSQIHLTPKMIVAKLLLGKERRAIGQMIIRLVESTRDDFFPGMPIQDFIVALLLLDGVYEQNERGREASASGLARTTGIPRATVQRRLIELDKKWHAIEQRRHRYVLNLTFFNAPLTMRGMPSRWLKIKRTSEMLVAPRFRSSY